MGKMRKKPPPRPEEIPPGARRSAFDRPTDPGNGPGSGAGPRHAAGDTGDANESTGATELDYVLGAPVRTDVADPFEEGPPFAGPAGGAVGGTPAQGRASGGRNPSRVAAHPAESTIGAKERRSHGQRQKKRRRS